MDPSRSMDDEDKESNPGGLLAPPRTPRQRRKSPVTVQEWVASLPPPHVLQRQGLEEEEGKFR